MNRTITVKGTGQISAKPDLVVISMELSSLEKTYKEAMEAEVSKISELAKAVRKSGFEEDKLKTISFNVEEEYKWQKDKNRNDIRVIVGFVCKHKLKLEFNFDQQTLATVLENISECKAVSEISIRFSVKDKNKISDELLQEVTKNATHRAKILCEALGAKVGTLIDITYNWGEINVYSETRYEAPVCVGAAPSEEYAFTPDNIDFEDTATFVWEIE